MSRAARPFSTRSSGFTLLELLIAISLLGLVFALLSGGVRFGMAAWKAGSEVRAGIDDSRIVQNVLLRQLESAIAMPADPRKPTGSIRFEGTRKGIKFVGPAPALAIPAGILRYSLNIENGADGSALVLSWQAQGTLGEGREKLVAGLQSAAFAYFGDPQGKEVAKWQDYWRDALVMPLAVRLTVGPARRPDRQWPPIIIRIRGSRH